MEPLPNTYLGQYLLQEVVGRSAWAVVYKAFQPNLNRRVAVKVLRGLDPDSIARFEREVQAIARLQHQNILPIYDFGQQDGQRFFVMRYVEGGSTLAHMLARGPMEPVAAMRLVCRLLDGLGYAHDQGIIHRDIKPSNILLPSPDWPLLADFGIAKLSNAGQLTPPGMVMGTVAYMAPEMALQGPIDSRADLYSTGVMLYEMLAGRVPFEGATPLALLGQHVSQPPPSLSGPHSAVPPAAEAVALRALAKAPADRYQSAAEMQAALAAAIRQVERASAQAWLMSQLGQGTTTATPVRSSYTTRKLPPEQQTTPALPRRTRSAPPVLAPLPRARRPELGLATGLLLLLAIGLLVWPLSGAPATPVPPAPEAPTTAPPTPAPPAPEAPTTAPPTPAPPTPAPPAAEAPTAPVVTAPAPITAGWEALVLEDTSWTGGYARSRGSNVYGGRTATWIYGTASEYSTMRATFEVAGEPTGEAILRIEGMDSEGPARTPISIVVNGTEIYRGPNPLPDDDFAYESGTWASETWRFDAELLRAGLNEVTISNLAEGAFGGPPFFMLDYAELTLEGG